MKSPLWLTLLVATAALSGCTSDDPPAPALTEEDCAALGLVLGTKDVMEQSDDESMDESMDESGAMEENSTGSMFAGRQAAENETGTPQTMESQHNEELACVPAGPPATITIDGLPASMMAYSTAAFQWTLHTDSEDEMHTMDTQIRIASASAADSSLGKPDTFGEQQAQKEHQNFFDGQSYDATWTPEEAGTYYVRAFALVNSENLWSPEYVVTVTEVVATGTSHTITCSNGGLPSVGSCSEDPLSIALGDEVSWANGNPGGLGSWTIHKTSGPDGQDISTTAGGAAVVFLVPGSYVYEADGDAGNVSGTINVASPAA